MKEDHTAKAVVVVTTTHTAMGMETTITVVVVPAMAVEEPLLAVVEAAYLSLLTRSNPFVTSAG